jgi:Protein of unknown function (DUF1579)
MSIRSAAPFLAGCATVLLLAATFDAAGQEPQRGSGQQEPQPSQQALQEMMAKAKKFTTPGPHHQKLERFLGTWSTTTRFVMGDEKSPPEQGSTTFRWLMPGRWMAAEGKGKLMGRPFDSFWLMGYDNFKQSYVLTSVQSQDTAMLRSEGDMTPDDKALITYGTLDEYLTGEHDKMVKYVFRFVDADHIVIEVHDLPIGETGTQVVEIAMTRG